MIPPTDTASQTYATRVQQAQDYFQNACDQMNGYAAQAAGAPHLTNNLISQAEQLYATVGQQSGIVMSALRGEDYTRVVTAKLHEMADSLARIREARAIATVSTTTSVADAPILQQLQALQALKAELAPLCNPSELNQRCLTRPRAILAKAELLAVLARTERVVQNISPESSNMVQLEGILDEIKDAVVLLCKRSDAYYAEAGVNSVVNGALSNEALVQGNRLVPTAMKPVIEQGFVQIEESVRLMQQCTDYINAKGTAAHRAEVQQRRANIDGQMARLRSLAVQYNVAVTSPQAQSAVSQPTQSSSVPAAHATPTTAVVTTSPIMSTTAAVNTSLTPVQQAQNTIREVASELELRAASIVACANRATSIADEQLNRSLDDIVELRNRWRSADRVLKNDKNAKIAIHRELRVCKETAFSIGGELNALLERVWPQNARLASSSLSPLGRFQILSIEERVSQTARLAEVIQNGGGGEAVFTTLASLHIAAISEHGWHAANRSSQQTVADACTQAIRTISDIQNRVQQRNRPPAPAPTSQTQPQPPVTQTVATTTTVAPTPSQQPQRSIAVTCPQAQATVSQPTQSSSVSAAHENTTPAPTQASRSDEPRQSQHSQQQRETQPAVITSSQTTASAAPQPPQLIPTTLQNVKQLYCEDVGCAKVMLWIATIGTGGFLFFLIWAFAGCTGCLDGRVQMITNRSS